MRHAHRLCAAGLALVAAGLLGGCPMEPPPPPPPNPILPIDYADTYTEVRGCRQSGDHDLHVIRVLADPDALGPYENRMDPFPVGSIVVKEEYDFGDADCSGEVVRWTVMQRLEDGSAPLDLDWYWQGIDADFMVDEDNPARCAQCHQGCGDPPVGYLGTCTEP